MMRIMNISKAKLAASDKSESTAGDQSVHTLKWMIVFIGINCYLFMAVSGFLAIWQGDYLRIIGDEIVGRAGPWTWWASIVGVDPFSDWIKFYFLSAGLFGLSGTIFFALYAQYAWLPLLICTIFSLWCIWLGTGFFLIMIMLLLIWRMIR